MLLLRIKSLVGSRNARQSLVMRCISDAGFGKPAKQAIQTVVKPARIAWIELFELLRN